MKEFRFKIAGKDYVAQVEELEGSKASVTINGKQYEVEMEEQKASAPVSRPTVARPAVQTAPAGKKVSKNIKSPLPGSIVKVMVAAGDSVKKGDVLLTMESMKMENQVLAEADGTVMSVRVKAGDSVMQDDVLIEFEGVEAAPAPQVAPQVAPKATPAPTPAPAPAPAPSPASKPAAGAKVVKSPLPGSIVKVVVKSGDSVKKGDVLLTMESMKMENNILAEQDGTVGNIFVQPGQNVMQDDNLLEIA